MAVSGKTTNISGNAPNYIVSVEVDTAYGIIPLDIPVSANDPTDAKTKAAQKLYGLGAEFANEFQYPINLK